jgi:hypothetical protein
LKFFVLWRDRDHHQWPHRERGRQLVDAAYSGAQWRGRVQLRAELVGGSMYRVASKPSVL